MCVCGGGGSQVWHVIFSLHLNQLSAAHVLGCVVLEVLDLKLSLQEEEVAHQLVAHRLRQHRVLLQSVQGLRQRLGQRRHRPLPLPRGSRGGALQLPLHPVQPGGDGGGQGEVGVAGGGRQAVLQVSARAARLGPEGARAVVEVPVDGAGRQPRAEALVAVDGGADEGAEGGRVLQQAGDPVASERRQLVGVRGVEEHVPVVLGPQRVVEVKTVGCLRVGGAGHEGGLVAPAAAERPDAVASQEDGVGRVDAVRGLQGDLVLAQVELVVEELDGNAGLAQRVHQVQEEGQVLAEQFHVTVLLPAAPHRP